MLHRRLMSTTSISRSAAPPWNQWRFSFPPPLASTSLSSLTSAPHTLPPLPLPKLDATLQKLIKSASALDQDHQLTELKRKVQDFENGVGPVLQKRLEERKARVDAEGTRNWLAEWWDKYAYMTYRDTVVGNVSYYYGFPPIPSRPSPLSTPLKNANTYHASALVLLAFQFRSHILDGSLKPDVAGGAPLCMESFKWAFGGCRMPGKNEDWGTVSHPPSPHFIVARRGWFWKVQFRQEFSLEDWIKVFEYIQENTPREEAKKVGVLTGIDRDTWSEAADYLKAISPVNSETIRTLQTSQFFIGLDSTSIPPVQAPPTSQSYNQMIQDWSVRLFLGGDEPYNRWWDTALQWIVEDGGFVGLIGEHSCMDGTPTARLHDWIGQKLLAHDIPSSPPSSSSSPSVEPSSVAQVLNFDVDQKAQSYILNAEKTFKEHTSTYNLEFNSFQDFGKESIKKIGVSPDAFCQMAIQLGYFKTHGMVCGTYESAMTRRFHLGRTEVVRSCTKESRRWVEAMTSDLDVREKKELFLEAVKAHGTDMKDASKAEGIDRHILGLKLSVAEGEETPELFNDELLQRSATWNLSTSQVYSPVFPAYGWGPVVQDGYGIPYMIHSESLQWTVTSKKHMPTRKLLDNIIQACKETMAMMEEAKAEESQTAKL